MLMKASARSWKNAIPSGQGSNEHSRNSMDYEITPEEVKGKLDARESFTLLDVREPWEFETARIDGAKLMPMGDVPSRAHRELDPADKVVSLGHQGVTQLV